MRNFLRDLFLKKNRILKDDKHEGKFSKIKEIYITIQLDRYHLFNEL